MTRLTLRGVAARRLRTALTGLAVILGVALISGSYVLTDTINRAFDDLFTQASSGVDVSISPREADFGEFTEPPPLPGDLLARVRAAGGVARAEGDVGGGASIRGKHGERLGSGLLQGFVDAANARPFDPWRYRDGRAPRGPGEAALDARTAREGGLRLGDTVRIVGAEGVRAYRVVGIARFGDADSGADGAGAILTLPEAQRVTGKVGELDEIQVQAASGVAAERLRTRLARELRGEPVAVRTGAEQADRNARDIAEDLAFLRTFLLVFGFIALFVGAFVIYNTFSITVAQRLRELALLRMLGASRVQVLQAVTLEALIVGVAGSLLGLAAGLALAPGLAALFDAIGLSLPGSGTVLAPRTVVVALLAGVLITVLASLGPAVRATRVAPVEALREGQAPAPRRGRARPVAATVLALAGIGLTLRGLLGGGSGDEQAGAVGAGAGVVFLAVALLSPELVRPLASVVGRVTVGRGITGRLARENAVRNPGRTAGTAAALMIGVALVAFVSIFAAGLQGSVDRSVDRSFSGDLTIVGEAGFGGVPAGVGRAVGDVPGVDAVAGVRFGQARVRGVGGTVQVVGVDAATIGATYRARFTAGDDAVLRLLGDDGVLVDAGSGVGEGRRVGDRLSVLTSSGARRTYVVRGLLDEGDFGLLGGGIVLPNQRLRRDFGVRQDGFLFLTFEPGADRREVRERVDRVLATSFPNTETQDRDELKDDRAARIDQLLGLIYVLLALSVLVSVVGIVNTLALSVYERVRELGLLRAIGTSAGQVRSIVRREAVITSLIGAVLGVVLGVLFAVLISRPLEEEGFRLELPVATLAGLLVLAAVLGVLAAIGPARRASRVDVLEALAYE